MWSSQSPAQEERSPGRMAEPVRWTMRRSVVLPLVLVLGSGCVATAPSPAADKDAPAAGLRAAEAGAADYTLDILRTWDTFRLQVVVIPPAYGRAGDVGQVLPTQGVYLKAILDAMTHWQEAIRAYGDPTIRDVTFDVWVAGRDALPPDWLSRTNVLVLSTPGPYNGFGGGPARAPNNLCIIGDFILPVLRYEDVFDLHAHEFGHCLGLNHPRNPEPWIDLMAYDDHAPAGAVPPRLDCVSNFDLLGLVESFAPAQGRAGASHVEMNQTDFVKFDCADRFLGPPQVGS